MSGQALFFIGQVVDVHTRGVGILLQARELLGLSLMTGGRLVGCRAGFVEGLFLLFQFALDRLELGSQLGRTGAGALPLLLGLIRRFTLLLQLITQTAEALCLGIVGILRLLHGTTGPRQCLALLVGGVGAPADLGLEVTHTLCGITPCLTGGSGGGLGALVAGLQLGQRLSLGDMRRLGVVRLLSSPLCRQPQRVRTIGGILIRGLQAVSLVHGFAHGSPGVIHDRRDLVDLGDQLLLLADGRHFFREALDLG